MIITKNAKNSESAKTQTCVETVEFYGSVENEVNDESQMYTSSTVVQVGYHLTNLQRFMVIYQIDTVNSMSMIFFEKQFILSCTMKVAVVLRT